MSDGRRYGDAIAHSHRLEDAPSLVTRTLRNAQIAATRISCGCGHVGMMRPIPPEDTFVAALFLTDTKRHELWSRGHAVIAQGYAANSMRIVNLDAEFSSNVVCPHEALSFYIPRTALDEYTDKAAGPRIANLACAPGTIDPVMAQLAAALLPAFDQPDQAAPLFVDHVMLAITAHIAQRYGGFAPYDAVRAGALSPALERRAKEYLTRDLSGNVTLAEVANACGLSRGYFVRAFRAATGITPHQWLQRYRIEKAKTLLLDNDAAIAQIALKSGFADQSHFTRVFTSLCGASPAVWRRENQTRFLSSPSQRNRDHLVSAGKVERASRVIKATMGGSAKHQTLK
jgi:AraC family transcriptional regulator